MAHLLIIQTKYPTCTNDLLIKIKEISSFQLVPEEQFNEWMAFFLEYLPSSVSFTENFEMAGYESGYLITNNIFVFSCVALYLVSQIFNVILWLVTRNIDCCRKTARSSYKRMIGLPGFFITLIIELAMDIFVNGIVEILMRQTTYPAEKVSYIFSVLLLISIVVLYGTAISISKSQNYKFRERDRYGRFHEFWGDLFEG